MELHEQLFNRVTHIHENKVRLGSGIKGLDERLYFRIGRESTQFHQQLGREYAIVYD
jgi:hypothetical protein